MCVQYEWTRTKQEKKNRCMLATELRGKCHQATWRGCTRSAANGGDVMKRANGRSSCD